MRKYLFDVVTLFCGSRKYLISSAVVLLGLNLVLYRFVLDIGFWSDDYHTLAPAARLSLLDYLVFYFDPRLQEIWYRPFQGMLLGIEYLFFGSNPVGYHIVQLLLHAGNCLLLFGLVSHVTHRWRIGFLTALIYSTWSIYSLAVYWVSVVDPLTSFFSLVSIWSWITYLETGGRLKWVCSFVMLVSALLTKETAVVLPGVLLLADRWLVGKPASMYDLFKRYVPFVLLLFAYILIESNVIMHGVHIRDSGYGIGVHILPVAIQYLIQLAFPWGLEPLLSYAWLVIVLAFFCYAATRRTYRVLFIGAVAVLTLLPVLPFRIAISRYLYFPLMASAIGFALLCDLAFVSTYRKAQGRWVGAALGLVLTLISLMGGATIGTSAENFAGFVRQTNLQLRPIFQRHATFAQDTLLYFVDLPFRTLNVSGAMALRYGPNPVVKGLDVEAPVGLRDHRAGFVFFYDDEHAFREQAVAPNVALSVTPRLPARLEEGIRLSRFELVSAKVGRGEAIIVFLYWHATKEIHRNLTVFAHLMDGNGNIFAGYDNQPARGSKPTSTWTPRRTYLDVIVLPIDSDVPVGKNYRLEVGMYDLATMERLSILDTNGQPLGDTFVFEPFDVEL